jgi:hypothetical protein
MPSSGILRRVALVRTDVLEDPSTSIIRVTRIGELGTTLAVSSRYLVFLRSFRWLLVTANFVPSSTILITLMIETLGSSETSLLSRATRGHIPEDAILHSHRRKYIKSYIALTGWTLCRRCNVSPERYELVFYILEDGILLIHRCENLKSGFLYPRKRHSS